MNSTEQSHLRVDPKIAGSQFLVSLQSGLQVLFPFEPYSSQKRVMEKVVQAISKAENCLVHSGTGTGKTLTMLASSLAWLRQNKQSNQKIIYLSRTHSQLRQVLQQLKRTPYLPLTAVIAARDQLCSHSVSKNLKGSALDLRCFQLRKKGGCKFSCSKQALSVGPICDIQSLVQQGRQQQWCPYYFSKRRAQQADLLLMPFNYLLDERLLDSSEISIQNSILIFDEAHNVDNIAQQGYSIAVTFQSLSSAERELANLVDSIVRYQANKNNIIQDKPFGQTRRMLKAIGSGLPRCKACMLGLQEGMSVLQKHTAISLESLNNKKFGGVDEQVIEDVLQEMKVVTDQARVHSVDIQSLALVQRFLKKLVKLSSSQEGEMFRVALNQKDSALEIVCLNPNAAFGKLAKARSIILCSGTLQPLDFWQKETGIQFRHKVIQEGYISCKHALVGVAESFMPGSSFDWSYGKQSNDMLNVLLKETSRCVPNGMLVCFSTYRQLQQFRGYTIKKSVEMYWQKRLFWQSKGQADRSLQQYIERASQPQGAILFCVLRGKITEGIDLAGQLCRAVIIIGVPFAPINDPNIINKKLYLHSQGRDPQRWYVSQAMRTVRQALGRVVRNPDDFGALILADYRYGREELKKELPDWCGQEVKRWQSVMDMRMSLQEFYKGKAQEEQKRKPLQKQVPNTKKITQPKATADLKRISHLLTPHQHESSPSVPASVCKASRGEQEQTSEKRRVEVSSGQTRALLRRGLDSFYF